MRVRVDREEGRERKGVARSDGDDGGGGDDDGSGGDVSGGGDGGEVVMEVVAKMVLWL